MLQALYFNKETGLTKIEKETPIAPLLKNSRNLVWVDMTNPSEDDIDILVDVFEFHQLAIEDAIFPQNYPKIDNYEEYLFIVVHELSYSTTPDFKVSTHELNIFFGKNYVLTIHTDPLVSISKIFQRCTNKHHSMQQGSGFLLHAIIDSIVDGYFPVVDRMEERIEEVEDQVLAGKDQKNVLEKIVELRKNLLTLRNFIAPQRKILGVLGRTDIPLIKRATATYFRDVYDHVVRVADMLDTYRDVLNSAMDAYLSVVSHKMNEIMKTLTIITTMMMPLTVITSFYGMNIRIPEFGWGIKGYWFVLVLLVLVVTIMLIFLKRKKWL